MADSAGSAREDIGKLLLRLAVGGLLLFHGIGKLIHGVAWMEQPLAALGLPGFVAYGAYVGEVLAPILIVLGFRARVASLFVAFDLIMAIVLVGRQRIFALSPAGGGWALELEMFYILAALALFFTGSGRYSVTKGRSSWD